MDKQGYEFTELETSVEMGNEPSKQVKLREQSRENIGANYYDVILKEVNKAQNIEKTEDEPKVVNTEIEVETTSTIGKTKAVAVKVGKEINIQKYDTEIINFPGGSATSTDMTSEKEPIALDSKEQHIDKPVNEIDGTMDEIVDITAYFSKLGKLQNKINDLIQERQQLSEKDKILDTEIYNLISEGQNLDNSLKGKTEELANEQVEIINFLKSNVKSLESEIISNEVEITEITQKVEKKEKEKDSLVITNSQIVQNTNSTEQKILNLRQVKDQYVGSLNQDIVLQNSDNAFQNQSNGLQNSDNTFQNLDNADNSFQNQNPENMLYFPNDGDYQQEEDMTKGMGRRVS